MQRKIDEMKGIANELLSAFIYVALTYAVALFIMR